nr:hypothetical protein [Brucella anthropi]
MGGAFSPVEATIRSGKYPQPGAYASPSGWSLKPCRPISAPTNFAIRASTKPKRSCANAYIAAFVPPRARPM